MKDEWQILAGYIAGLGKKAPRSIRGIVDDLHCEFVALQESRDVATRLMADLASAGALADSASEVWDRYQVELHSRWRGLLSRTAQADIAVQQASTRKRSVSIDHAIDHEVALHAFIEWKLGSDLNPAILSAAERLGARYRVGAVSYCQRIRRIIDDPRERIASRVSLALREAMDQLQKAAAT